MNDQQRRWWVQARSDHEVFGLLRANGAHECHLLHYLQMASEKLSKAYLWRSGNPPPRSHTGFVRFLKALLDQRSAAELKRKAKVLGFDQASDLERWVKSVGPLAYAIQNIAPAEAADGPNPEYPWPHEAPAQSPVEHSFALWTRFKDTGQGRKLIEILDRMVERFDQIG